MTEEQRASFVHELVEGNRALMVLGTIDIGQPDSFTSVAVRQCMGAYERLLQCQTNMQLSAEEASGLAGLLHRLKVHLKVFGEKV
jgi:hypothetical protein